MCVSYRFMIRITFQIHQTLPLYTFKRSRNRAYMGRCNRDRQMYAYFLVKIFANFGWASLLSSSTQISTVCLECLWKNNWTGRYWHNIENKKKNRKRKRSENAYSKKKVCRASNHQKNAGQPLQKAKKKMNRTGKKREIGRNQTGSS